MTDTRSLPSQDEIKVWDRFVRVFHWSLVIGVAVAWLTADDWGAIHEPVGYAIAALLGIRLVWGLIGPRYARFAQFVRPPKAVAGYLGAMLRGREHRYIGHNPAGGAMVVALLTLLSLIAITGWASTLDSYTIHKVAEEVHEGLANGLLFLVALHVVGVIVTSLRHGENLVRAMVTGRKHSAQPGDIS